MRYGIPVLKGRVAPRCTIAEGLLITTRIGDEITDRRIVPPEGSNWFDFLAQLGRARIDTLVCGGISRDEKDSLLARGVDVIDNVACTLDEAVGAIAADELRAGFGFDIREDHAARGCVAAISGAAPSAPGDAIDCLACGSPVCLLGRTCTATCGDRISGPGLISGPLLESARDITFEQERKLCRLSELIYFALELNYHKLGLAYCIDLAEPARILVGALRRFFDVVPVCCKVGGIVVPEPGGEVGDVSGTERPIACNPLGQARLLNAAGTDLNVLVGLCIGTDAEFTGASEAPVSTLFVKDKSLANNPIGALYSDFYLKEAAWAPASGG